MLLLPEPILRRCWPIFIYKHRKFSSCSGYEVDIQGDAFFVAFARATDAILVANKPLAFLENLMAREVEMLSSGRGLPCTPFPNRSLDLVPGPKPLIRKALSPAHKTNLHAIT